MHRKRTPQRDAGASTGPWSSVRNAGFHARHSSRELDPVTQTPCPEDRSGSDPSHQRWTENRAGLCGMVPGPAEPEPAAQLT